ncbi:MAG: hypothetical protein LBK95_20695 [Bifidobacteriaceae bacterium]|jgi:hypothetical protein|nr:hypothetical protein [Bifidobacteriaceae bacterium]
MTGGEQDGGEPSVGADRNGKPTRGAKTLLLVRVIGGEVSRGHSTVLAFIVTFFSVVIALASLLAKRDTGAVALAGVAVFNVVWCIWFMRRLRAERRLPLDPPMTLGTALIAGVFALEIVAVVVAGAIRAAT